MSNTDAGAIEQKASIFNVQRFNIYDGPGVRTIIFFKGCPLRCEWCSNPEGLGPGYDVMVKSNVCTDCGACVGVCPVDIHMILESNNKHKVRRDIQCIGCHKCEGVCPASALFIAGEEKSISELLEIVEKDRAFYDTSGGGITIGGGEPLLQPEAATNLLMKCKQEGINTAIETSGYAKQEVLLKVAEFVDLFLFDIKHISPEKHLEFTGVRNELILSNLQELIRRGYNVVIRMPLLKGVNSSKEDIEKVIDFLKPFRECENFKGIDLLPYHKMGVHKYQQLDKEYLCKEDASLNAEEMNEIENWFKAHDFNVRIVNH
jgi:pyruvate formate lyase activating enzyme